MDYQRIYDAFIASRKEAETTLNGYVERHHITPRSFCGPDDPDNLVKLTPEDHFFAHLLLAKIHGGKMSAALYCMMQVAPNHWGRRMHSRGRYGLAKRLAIPALREAFSGANNPLYNPTMFEWVNVDTGQTRMATMMDMHANFGGTRPHWTSVVSGHRKTMKGWTVHPSAVKIRSNKGKLLSFVNRDGRTFDGTQGEFAERFGLNPATASRITRHKSVSVCGWRLRGVADRSHNAPISGARPGPKGEVFRFKRGDEIAEGQRSDVAVAFGVSPACVSAAVSAIRKGTMKTYKGWTLAA